MICWCCWEKIDVGHDCDTTVTSQSYCRSCTKQVPGTTVTAKEGRLKSEFAFFHWSSSRLQNMHRKFEPSMSATYHSSSYQQKDGLLLYPASRGYIFAVWMKCKLSATMTFFFQVLDKCHSRFSATITNHPSHKFSFSLGIVRYVFYFIYFFLFTQFLVTSIWRQEIWIASVSQRYVKQPNWDEEEEILWTPSRNFKW